MAKKTKRKPKQRDWKRPVCRRLLSLSVCTHVVVEERWGLIFIPNG